MPWGCCLLRPISYNECVPDFRIDLLGLKHILDPSELPSNWSETMVTRFMLRPCNYDANYKSSDKTIRFYFLHRNKQKTDHDGWVQTTRIKWNTELLWSLVRPWSSLNTSFSVMKGCEYSVVQTECHKICLTERVGASVVNRKWLKLGSLAKSDLEKHWPSISPVNSSRQRMGCSQKTHTPSLWNANLTCYLISKVNKCLTISSTGFV